VTDQVQAISSETVVIPYPIYGNYRLQFGPDTGTSSEEFVNPGPRAYADDEGGIWLFARHPMMQAEVTVSVWPVGARPPVREGALIGYDGEFEVPDVSDEPVEGWVLGEVNVPRDDITLSTRLEPGVWAVLIQVTGQDEADRARSRPTWTTRTTSRSRRSDPSSTGGWTSSTPPRNRQARRVPSATSPTRRPPGIAEPRSINVGPYVAGDEVCRVV
jgi:hypothetical protein